MDDKHSITNLLRKALADGPSIAEVSRATGVTRQTMMAFRDGASMRLDIADKLAKYFGLECRMTKPRKGKRPAR